MKVTPEDIGDFLFERKREELNRQEEEDEAWEILLREQDQRKQERKKLLNLVDESVNIILSGLRPKERKVA